ncbi:GntR family transcriptional regulator [Roseomonas sp. HJA6]|uniref:GntR family transcriptional regulator n=1 Tax=Roseomonas alba TaxID=2846776 RepID=A0ABS7A7I7_9PROT|nr:GntR family transcriptional regulator [Neoroseomonas alba]MBW6398251.1 GntR family transcriptional regulator [Neoroseomonas alba]
MVDIGEAPTLEAAVEADTAKLPASQRAYVYIRDRILNGELASDTFVEEEHISTLIGVSRTPVREAFSRLQAEHLIDLVPRRGARVRGVTLREMFEFYEARRIIEGHVAGSLCRAKAGAPPAMRSVLAEMRRELPTPGPRYMVLDAALHQALVAASSNEVLMEMYAGLSTRQRRVALISLKIQPRRPALIHEQHEALVDALERHDEEAAHTVLEAHLRPIRDVVSYYRGGPADAP